jgi:4-aminobutyrate aminotransferase-like enzyme
METAKDRVEPASAAIAPAGARGQDLTPAQIDKLAAAGDFAAISKPHLSPILGRYYERSWSHGEGHTLYDSSGRGFLDFACGIATTSLGHHHPAVTAGDQGPGRQAAPHLQRARISRAGRPPRHPARGLLSRSARHRLLLQLGSRGDRGRPQAGPPRDRSAGHRRLPRRLPRPHLRRRLVTSSSINYRLGYEPLLPSVYLTPFPNVYRYFGDDEEAATAGAMGALRTLLGHEIPASSVAAIIIEPIQGEGGFNPAPASFCASCEPCATRTASCSSPTRVQSGIARTGKMWAFEDAGIVPDVVCVAKALANGMPIGAIVTRRELQERWGVGAHGTTFGGNPVSCAAGVAVMNARSRRRG